MIDIQRILKFRSHNSKIYNSVLLNRSQLFSNLSMVQSFLTTLLPLFPRSLLQKERQPKYPVSIIGFTESRTIFHLTKEGIILLFTATNRLPIRYGDFGRVLLIAVFFYPRFLKIHLVTYSRDFERSENITLPTGGHIFSKIPYPFSNRDLSFATLRLD